MAEPSSCPPLTPSSIRTAHKLIQPYIHRTPLITCKTLDRIASSPDPRSAATYTATSSSTNGIASQSSSPKIRLFFKCENQQKIGAFKARGAHHAVLHLIDALGISEVRRRGVVTHSSGNHAQALALAASTFEIPAYIVMPTISTPSKIAGTKLYTENVLFSGSTSQEREAKVEEVIRDTGAILVPPYDHPDIILGQGTAGLELDEQHKQSVRESGGGDEEDKPKDLWARVGSVADYLKSFDLDGNPTRTEEVSSRLDTMMVPLGGGGLLSGIATYFSDSREEGGKTYVFGCEPSYQGCDDARRGLASSPPKRIEHVSSLTIADGLRTPVGVLNWSVVADKEKVEAVYAVSEEEIKSAMRLVFERMKVVVEPSGCVGLAVVLYNQEFRRWLVRKQEEEGKGRVWDVGVVFSGGNTTMEAIAGLFSEQNNKEEQEERAESKIGMDGGREAEDVAG